MGHKPNCPLSHPPSFLFYLNRIISRNSRLKRHWGKTDKFFVSYICAYYISAWDKQANITSHFLREKITKKCILPSWNDRNIYLCTGCMYACTYSWYYYIMYYVVLNIYSSLQFYFIFIRGRKCKLMRARTQS